MASITRIWILYIITRHRFVYSQIPFPIYPHFASPMQPMMGMVGMPPPPPPPPMPIPIPVHIPFAIRIEQTTTTSTSGTTESSIAIAVPIPLPMPMQIAFPAFPPPRYCQGKPRPYNCPPCPPCMCTPTCTPAFFAYCSPCHQKCKCRSNALVPLPPPRYHIKDYHRKSSCSDDSSRDSSSSSSEWDRGRKKMRRRNKRKNVRNMRRNFQISDMESSDSELVKPVLTYISKNGEIKFKKRISTDEAAQLLGDRPKTTHQNVKVVAGEDHNGKSQVLIVSNDAEVPADAYHRRQVVLKEGTAHHVLGEGKKELIFRPADNKKISNFSVSFQVVT